MPQPPHPVALLVEDEINLREVLRFQLSGAGFRIIEARSRHDALRVIDQELPDLIVSHIGSGADGIRLLSAVRMNPRTARIPLLFLTSEDGIEDRLHAFALGANDYIVKPWDDRELVARARALIRWSLRDQLN